MTSTYSQVAALHDSLSTAQGSVSWQIGKTANVLISQAQREHPENAVLASIEPFAPSIDQATIASMSADDVRAILKLVMAATDEGVGIG